MHAFLKRCEGVWEDSTGERHDLSPSVEMLWKNAVINVLPPSVQARLEDVVGLDTKPTEEWRQHLLHHDVKYQATKIENDEEFKLRQSQRVRSRINKEVEEVSEEDKVEGEEDVFAQQEEVPKVMDALYVVS
ncbi:hypothetical protein NQZ68_015150 [Dissostichus eleginoides]|nr:hypothetical protein NQZ68_015150 [Dissostichus eleginoides]